MASKADINRRFRVVGQDDPFERSPEPQARALSLGELQRFGARELLKRYRDAETPTSLTGLNGDGAGTLLTLGGPLSVGIARQITTRIASSSRFPWAGKTFESWADDRGSGINRVRVLGPRQWFHFETRIDRSMIDGRATVVLDYNHALNPWPVRQIRDELRPLSDTLWFGPALLRGRPVLYFAVQTP